MTETDNRVIFTPPDYESRAVLDVLVRALTGQSLAAITHDMIVNPGEKYDIYAEEETT